MNKADWRLLAEFLEHPARPDGTLWFHELQGFLFAVASSPETIAPSEWLPMIGDEEGPELRRPRRGTGNFRPDSGAV